MSSVEKRTLYTRAQRLVNNSRTKVQTIKSILNNTLDKEIVLRKFKSTNFLWMPLIETGSVPNSRIGKWEHLLDPIALGTIDEAIRFVTGTPELIELFKFCSREN